MINLNFKDNSKRLDPFKNKLEIEFKESIKKIAAKIPINNVEITVLDAPNYCIPELGIGGYSKNAKELLVYLDPEFKDIDKTIEKFLERTLAHELHHCLRWQNPGYGETLLEALISEGLADHFEIEISNGDIALWDVALDNQQIQEWLQKASLEYSNKKYNHNEWFFGSKDKGIPRWTGYTLGFNLVDNYFKKNPKQKASTIFNKKAEEFLK